MKAQAAGCVPVTVNYAALNETVKAGVLVDGKCGEGTVNQELKSELIRLLKDPQEQEKYRESVLSVSQMFGWDKVAKEWEEKLFSNYRYRFSSFDEYKKIYHQELKDVTPSNIDVVEGKFNLDQRMGYVGKRIMDMGLKSAIDFGCGDGVLCFTLEKNGINAVGVEINKGIVDFNNNFAQKIGAKCSFLHSSVEEFETDCKYDVAILMDVLEHTMYPEEMIKAVENCVNDDGYIIVSTPDKNGFFGDSDDNPQHINLYDKERLVNFIGKERIIDFTTINDVFVVTYKKRSSNETSSSNDGISGSGDNPGNPTIPCSVC
jgi:2-polyprenyl-3-methyl-5-hydroxy-6-metoxy-1,4-benzoquinol methylase